MSIFCRFNLHVKEVVVLGTLGIMTGLALSCSVKSFTAADRRHAAAETPATPQAVPTPPPEPVEHTSDTDDICHKKIAVSLAFDVSGSMNNEKLILIRKSSEILISSLAKDDLSSLVVFNTKASELAPLSHHHDETLQQLAPETMGRIAGNTDISSGLIAAARQLKEADDEEYHKVLILLSDGEHNTGEAPVDIADEIKNSGNVQLISIIALRDMGFLGNIMGASPAVSQIFAPFSAEGKETMKAIASSAKDYKEAANSELLKKSFTTIKEELCRK